jgi:phosphoribulokinase
VRRIIGGMYIHIYIKCGSFHRTKVNFAEICCVQDIADPFFAYCKQHADKSIVRLKRRNWLAMQSRIKTFEDGISDKEKVQIDM